MTPSAMAGFFLCQSKAARCGTTVTCSKHFGQVRQYKSDRPFIFLPLPTFAVKQHTMWTEQSNTLYRRFEFADFSEAFAFMTRVAIEAEKANHHPLWTNVWNKVEIWLSTHDAGNIVTDKDRALAAAIDKLVKA
jgi:4a-hydroxytetrahydrobiopterin dehydratase